jgi:aldose 1-epimerase
MPAPAAATVTRASFGALPDGRPVESFVLVNARGMRVHVIALGGIIVSLEAPDRDGRVDDVALGYDTLAPYLDDRAYFGALIGRYGNRIGGARFTLDGVDHGLTVNDGPNHLHGGRGFHTRLWDAEPFTGAEGCGLRLAYTSPDGEDGYPGTLEARVTYTLTDANELRIDYRATTDRATPCNLTQHSYFNLAGQGVGDILSHALTLAASAFTPVDAGLIPTGEIRAVAGTPFDFTTPHAIGARIDAPDPQIAAGGGYDHNFVLDRAADGDGLALAARVHEPRSGRVLEIFTTEPGIQFYSGNMLPDGLPGKAGRTYHHHGGFALETQHFPDSPNQPQFPSTILRPGETYASTTVYRFGTR